MNTDTRCRRGFAALVLLGLFGVGAVPDRAQPQAQPVPGPSNSFHILTIWDGLSRPTVTDEIVSQQMDKYIQQIGKGNKYNRGGFAFVYTGADILRARVKSAHDKGLCLGIIVGGNTHTDAGMSNALAGDFRSYQWRRDGVTWEGYPVMNAQGQMVPNNEGRDFRVASPSRLNAPARAYFHNMVLGYGKDILPVLAEYPGTVGVVDAIIEEELATGGVHDEKWMADYSPFAVTEFRDWLRHTGIYDADTGKYAGQGAQAAIVGTFVTVGGKSRSPFYDDPNPGNANGTGVSFNARFGTAFTTWTLRSWDLKAFPDPITDLSFMPTPVSGKGYTAGGFDAPRVRDNGAFWNAWSWDYEDHANTYPPGNPANPAFGFRQVMVRDHIMDFLDDMAAQGFPKDMLFAHQIPGEFNPTRNRSGATPIWTGLNPHTGNLGITKFGPLDVKLVRQYSDNWGIFEWHPSPFVVADDPTLYPDATKELNLLYANKVRFLFPGWWFAPGEGRAEDIHGTHFPMNDSRFADAIKDFLASRTGEPYNYVPTSVEPSGAGRAAARLARKDGSGVWMWTPSRQWVREGFYLNGKAAP